MQSKTDDFLQRYEVDDEYLVAAPDLSGKPNILSAEKDGEIYIIKQWPRTPEVNDDEVEAIWLHELRQLHRLKGYPGVEDLIATLVDSGRDQNGFYLVLDAQERLPLTCLMKQRALGLRSHWIKRLKSPASRIIFWENIIRIADAIEILHGQGLLHRQLDDSSILTSITPHNEYKDFQLTGFEWSMRVPTLTSAIADWPNASNDRTVYSFATDWADLGRLIAKILNIAVNVLEDLSTPFKQMAIDSDLMLIEISFIRKLLGVVPFRANVSQENLDGGTVKKALSEIIEALKKNVSTTSSAYDLAIKISSNPDATRSSSSVTSRIQDIYKIKYGVTLDHTNIEELKRFVEQDIKNASTLVKSISTSNSDVVYFLKGQELFYQLGCFKPNRSSDEESWEIAVCERAHVELPYALSRNVNSISLSSDKIRVLSIAEAYDLSRRNPENISKNIWSNLFHKFEVDDSSRSPEQQKLIDGFVACHLTEIAYARAEIFPVDILDTREDGDNNWRVELFSTKSEDAESLAASLGLESPALRLEKILSKSEGDFEALVWSLVSNSSLGKEEEEVLLTFQEFYKSDEGQLIFVFTSRQVLPFQQSYFIAPNSLQGTFRQLSRRAKALDTLETHSELVDVLMNPQKHAITTSTPKGIEKYFDSLDESKQDAFQRILTTLSLYLVQGPPGVGKTYLVSTLIKHLFEEEPDSRVLLTAQSHSTVQHLFHEVYGSGLGDSFPQDLLVIRCSKQDKNDETSLSDADEKAKSYLRCFLDSDLYASSTSDEVKSEVRSMLNGTVYKRHSLINQLLRSANIVFSTTNSEQVERMIKDRAQFDWSIMEETGKVTGLELVSPLLLSHRRLMIGDHKQLPPYRSNEIKTVLTSPEKLRKVFQEGESIFNTKIKGETVKTFLTEFPSSDEAVREVGRIAAQNFMLFQTLVENEVAEAKNHENIFGSKYGRTSIGSMLSVQHRMHPDIAEIISDVFYNGDLKTDKEKELYYRGLETIPPFIFDGIQELKESKVLTWIDMPDVQLTKYMSKGDETPRWHNSQERKVVAELLKRLHPISGLSKKAKIAVLSPYSEQVGRISRLIYNKETLRNEYSHLSGFDSADDHSDFCSTVDGFQGSEADLVIVSLVRNNGNATMRSALGFLADERRMNVLLSRARHKLIVVGSYDFLKSWAFEIRDKGISRERGEGAFLFKLIEKIEKYKGEGEISFISSSKLVDENGTSGTQKRKAKGAKDSNRSRDAVGLDADISRNGGPNK
ncbi:MULTISPECIES: DEAD/DEAH box helicase family protein [Pseudomonas syringae group]|nr:MULTISPECIES: ATP-binding protein [Pseudomonas syringae group]MDU8643945.1 AAA domain-containing protein [Pseudomonas syringae group sp. 26L6]